MAAVASPRIGAYAPLSLSRLNASGSPGGAGAIRPTAPTSLVFTNKYCSAGLTEPPDHVAPPSVPGNESVSVGPGGV